MIKILLKGNFTKEKYNKVFKISSKNKIVLSIYRKLVIKAQIFVSHYSGKVLLMKTAFVDKNTKVVTTSADKTSAAATLTAKF